MSSSFLPPQTANKRLEGKVAVITGGASGIGEATARLFCQHGANVVIADVQDELGQSVCRDIGPSATYVHCDVTNEDDVKNVVDKVVSDHGKLDIMFNNAGVAESGGYTSFSTTEKSEFERIMAVNVTGVFLGIKHAARVMAPLRRGSIVVTASVASVLGGITPHGYTCSKHAVVGLVKNAAVELGRVGVRVNSVSPHLMATPLASNAFGMQTEELERYATETAVLQGLTLRTNDIADAVLYLTSDESRYVSGHNLVVDGSYSMVNVAIPSYKSVDP